MTRAWLRLLQGDLPLAFSTHPLFFLPPLALLLLPGHRHLPPSLIKTLLTLGLILVMGVYLTRLFDPTDTVVVFAPRQGILYRLLEPYFALFP